MPWESFSASGIPIVNGGSASSFDFVSPLANGAIAVTAATTATIGRMHYVTGTSADYTVMLPAAATLAGQHLAFVFGPTTTELSKFVTIDGNASEKINGLLSRVFWAGEALTIECDGSNWWVVDYKFMPMSCEMQKASQSISSGTDAQVTLDTTNYDNTGNMANTGSNKMTCRRTGRYQIMSWGQWSPTLASGIMRTFPKVNGVATLAGIMYSIGGGNFFTTQVHQPNVAITAAQDITLFAGSFSAGSETVTAPTISVTEQAGW